MLETGLAIVLAFALIWPEKMGRWLGEIEVAGRAALEKRDE